MNGKPVAAGVAEPDGEEWEELADEWEAFPAGQEAGEEGEQ